MFHRTLASLTLLVGAAIAQTPPCISLNDTNNTVTGSLTSYGFAGPNVYAYQFTPANSMVLMAAQIYTESTAFSSPRGYSTLEIWDTNFIFLPQNRLGGGTWQNQPSLGVAWQGASFDQFIALNANETYWLVWRESGGHRLPYEPGGNVVTTCNFSGGTWQLQATSQAIKWRGFCSLLDDANVETVGFGCQSSLSAQPSAFTNNAPSIGNADFQVEASGFPAGNIGLVLFGTDPTWVSLPLPLLPSGCFLHTDVIFTATVTTGTGNQQALHTTGASGHTWFDLPIPANPGLAGAYLSTQFAVIDALPAPLPLVMTNGLRLTLF